jgi:hypothetical protein
VTKVEDATFEVEEDDEEDYTVYGGGYNSTLRQAAAYALKLLAELYPEAVFTNLRVYID